MVDDRHHQLAGDLARTGGCAVSGAERRTTTEVLEGIDLTGEVVVITGGSTGIGFETARALGAAGASIMITARSEEKGEDAVARLRDLVPGGAFDYEILELGSLDSVRACAADLRRRLPRIDVLVCNAGIMAVPFGRTDDEFELQFGTNHLGHFVLVGRLLPSLLLASPSRIVLLSSAGHGMSDILWDDPNFLTTTYQRRPSGKWMPFFVSEGSLTTRDYGLPCTRGWWPPISAVISPPRISRTSPLVPRQRPRHRRPRRHRVGRRRAARGVRAVDWIWSPPTSGRPPVCGPPPPPNSRAPVVCISPTAPSRPPRPMPSTAMPRRGCGRCRRNWWARPSPESARSRPNRSAGSKRELLAVGDAIATIGLFDPTELDETGDGLVDAFP
ncbi:MAG: SDR family NAD(P)-dependent oxidoreductase [Actinobacteria bacterium]|nr:SDR family NAD(P)-dependent oxidoreductase [Actinomycetota bacterium]